MPQEQVQPQFTNCQYHIEKLRRGKNNVRTVNSGGPKKPRMSHAQLVESIAAVGLISPLVVVAAEDGFGDVEAGGGRLEALQALWKSGRLTNPMIDCRESKSADPVAISLIENIAREPMHPADECVAFKRLVDEGRTLQEVAAMFSMRVIYIRQRLALAGLHDKLLALFKADKMTLDVAEAMTLEPDPARQLSIWKRLEAAHHTGDVYYVREAITDQEVDSDDKLVKFVGLQTYVEHGGELREDLFADEGARVLKDPALLEHLAFEKLEVKAEELRAQGCAWVEVSLDVPHDAIHRMVRLHNNPSKDDRAQAGYFLYLTHSGQIHVNGPFITKDAAKAKAKAKAVAEGGESLDEAGEGDRVPESLMRSLTAHKTAAIQCALLANQRVTLALLAARIMSERSYETLPLHVSFSDKSYDIAREARGYDQTRAATELAAADKVWEGRVGEDALAYFLEQPEAVSLEAIAYAAARSFGIINTTQGTPYGVAAVQAALDFKLADYFKPTAETYLGQVPKAKLVAAVTEAVSAASAAPLEKMKKGDAVAAAASQLAGTAWVPAAIR